MPSENSSREPEWWAENEEIKHRYDLPEYDAPRFKDGEYVHDVVAELETTFDVQIRLLNSEPVGNGVWEINVNGDVIAECERYRDEKANSVFEVRSEEFRDLVASSVG